MREETIRENLKPSQVSRLVASLNDINFCTVKFAKNLWYVLPSTDKGGPEVRLEPYDSQYASPKQKQFAGFEKQNYVGVIKKSSASAVLYKEDDHRTEFLGSGKLGHGYYDKFKKAVWEV